MLTHLVERMLGGDSQALARLISLLEDETGEQPALMRAVHPRLGDAYCVGVTGLPGAGKSTIVDRLIEVQRRRGMTVGVLAVDPASPFSGGAVLGDRIRMNRHTLDQGVFVRSLSTRSARGGLSRVAMAAVRLLDAFGKDVIMVETVGVGQTELDVMNVADTVVVTLMPEAGDAVQALKAGLMEIGDVFVVNKADRPHSRRIASTIESEVRASRPKDGWVPPVILIQAHRGEGIDRLHEAILAHRADLEKDSRLQERRARRRKTEFIRVVRDEVEASLGHLQAGDDEMGALVAKVERGEIDPYSAAAEALRAGRLLHWLARRSATTSANLPPVRRGFEPTVAVERSPGRDAVSTPESFLGIDITSSERKPSACSVLDSVGRLRWLGFERTDRNILALAGQWRPLTVAIDAPLGLPRGMDCLEESCGCSSVWPFKGRKAERELISRGMSLYVTTKRSFIKPMIYRAMALTERLRTEGHKVIEVYPYATKVRLFGRPVPKKTTKEGLLFLKERLLQLVSGVDAYVDSLDHDLCDALLAAYTAYLYKQGRTEALGLEEEGRIVVPSTA